MKAIMISDKSKWCFLMIKGDKNIEVRTSEALANAIQKLIDEYGYADIYVYCSKGKPNLWLPYEYDCFNLDEASRPYLSEKPIIDIDTKINGKVVFKFRCYKVEEIDKYPSYYKINGFYYTHSLSWDKLEKASCLSFDEINEYLKAKTGYAIHISDLEIFKPKELSEFRQPRDSYGKVNWNTNDYYYAELTKAPQNFVYVEVE